MEGGEMKRKSTLSGIQNFMIGKTEVRAEQWKEKGNWFIGIFINQKIPKFIKEKIIKDCVVRKWNGEQNIYVFMPKDFSESFYYRRSLQILYEKTTKLFNKELKLLQITQNKNLSGMENNDLTKKILDLVEKSLIDTEKSEWIDMAKLTDNEVNRIKSELGFDLTDYLHVIDNSHIYHTLKKHGNQKIEEKRGQVAVVPVDFTLITYITQNADIISKGINDKGLETIKYEKKIIDTYFVVEEIRSGRKKLALNTMYKKKSPTKKINRAL